MKVRAGRKQPQNLYMQLGSFASDDDQYIGVIFDPECAAVLIDILNGDRPPFERGSKACPDDSPR